MAEPETEELRIEQRERARSELQRAQAAAEPAEEQAHARRAERAAYLERKLAERGEAEERVQDGS
jgi:hypothetical protein